MEELKTPDMTSQLLTYPSQERLREIFEQAEPCEIDSARFMLDDDENIVELFTTFNDADGQTKTIAIRFAVEPAYLWSAFETDYRLKMIQAYGEFTSRMVAEAIDDHIKRIRRATLKQRIAQAEDTRKETRPRFNEAVYRCKDFVTLLGDSGADRP